MKFLPYLRDGAEKRRAPQGARGLKLRGRVDGDTLANVAPRKGRVG